MFFVFNSIASLVMTECACASLIFTFITDVKSLVCVEPKHLNWSTSSTVCPFCTNCTVCMCHLYVGRGSWLDAVDDTFALVGADFPVVFSRCFRQSLSELLQFFFTGSKQIDVIGKPQVAKRSFSDECTGVRAFCLLHYLLQE